MNITFLDYKLILLIGLAIVIYFLYYEIKIIKNKLKNVEDKLNNKIYKTKDNFKSFLNYKDIQPNCTTKLNKNNYTFLNVQSSHILPSNDNHESYKIENNESIADNESIITNKNDDNESVTMDRLDDIESVTTDKIDDIDEIYSNETSHKENELSNNEIFHEENNNNNILINENKLNNIELNKLKLTELKEIAKNNNIVLIKNNKIKNKQELINEILEKNI